MFKNLILLAAISVAVLGQAPPSGFSGTIVSYADDSATLKDKEGKTIVVQMTPGWTTSIIRVADTAAIKPGDFVATQNAVVDATTGRAIELRVLEPGYRPEDSTHGMDGSPNQMTHGTVAKVSKAEAGVELNVTFPGGSRRIIVPSTVTVTVSDRQDRKTLTPGSAVSGVTRMGPDGVRRASRLVLAR
jgi:hypothetical protein